MPPAGHIDGDLRHAVARGERLLAEAGGGEPLGEGGEDIRLDGLGAVGRVGPVRQVELGDLGVGDPTGAQVVGEVGREGDVDPAGADGAQPADRPTGERHGVHQDAAAAAQQGGQQLGAQAHVVVERHPAAAAGLLGPADGSGERLDVVQHIAVGDHDALGVAGGTGGVLEQRQRVLVQGDGVQSSGSASRRPSGRVTTASTSVSWTASAHSRQSSALAPSVRTTATPASRAMLRNLVRWWRNWLGSGAGTATTPA